MHQRYFQSPGYDLKIDLPRSRRLVLTSKVPKIAKSIAATGVELEYLLTLIMWTESWKPNGDSLKKRLECGLRYIILGVGTLGEIGAHEKAWTCLRSILAGGILAVRKSFSILNSSSEVGTLLVLYNILCSKKWDNPWMSSSRFILRSGYFPSIDILVKKKMMSI